MTYSCKEGFCLRLAASEHVMEFSDTSSLETTIDGLVTKWDGQQSDS
jgi:hypothetical protein